MSLASIHTSKFSKTTRKFDVTIQTYLKNATTQTYLKDATTQTRLEELMTCDTHGSLHYMPNYSSKVLSSQLRDTRPDINLVRITS